MAVNWKENYQRYKNLFWKNYEYYRKREDIRNYVELILNLVAISVFSLFAIKPTVITIIDLNKQIKAKEETIQKMNTKIKNLQQAQNLIDQERSSIDLLDKAIPKEPQAEEFIHSLGGIATLNNLTIKNIGTKSITILGTSQEVSKSNLNLPEGTNMVTFSASFIGKFTDLDEFIKKLENFLRPVDFKQLSINKPQEKEGEKTEDLNLGITIDAPYYQLIKTQSQPKTANQSQTKKEEVIPEK